MPPRRPLGLSLPFALALAPGCLPVFTPPLRADFGVAKRAEVDRPFLRPSIGAHAASLALSPDFPVDAGAGYVAYVRGRPAPGGGPGPNQTLHGAYAEASARVAGGEFWRAFAGARGEVLFPELAGDRTGHSALGRLAAEALVPVSFEPVHGSSRGGGYAGMAYGVFAIGAYLEAGEQQLPDGSSAAIVGAGLTLRAPATAGLLCCLWPKD